VDPVLLEQGMLTADGGVGERDLGHGITSDPIATAQQRLLPLRLAGFMDQEPGGATVLQGLSPTCQAAH
jgi:hypothetical protein